MKKPQPFHPCEMFSTDGASAAIDCIAADSFGKYSFTIHVRTDRPGAFTDWLTEFCRRNDVDLFRRVK